MPYNLRFQASVLWIAGALLLSFSLAAAENHSLGDGVQLTTTTSIHDILERPDDFLGKTVRIEGEALDVCPRKGCWIELNDGDGTLRVKVQDDVIVFPADSVGRVMAAEGVVEAIERSKEQHLAWLAHLAEERGETFDAAAADVGEGPFRWIQVRGSGAVVLK